MTKEELMRRLTEIEIALANQYNHLPQDNFTRTKVAKAIDDIIKLIADVALSNLK